MKLLKLAPLVLVLGTLACGGSSPPPAAPAEPAPPASAEPAPAPASSATTSASSEAAPAPAPAATEWKAMDKEARGKYMKEVVMPKMKELFTAFDAKEFGAMNCATCHGKSVADHSFKMPNPDLPKLPSDMAEFKKWAGKHPKTTEFMVKQVKPEMAKLLGLPEFNPETKVGFGCGGCHTMK